MTSNSYDTPVLDTYHAVVLAFSDFLTVAIHTILYERSIYPRESFLSARKYNFPVKQSRHPKCTVASTSLVIHSPASEPLERYLFSTSSFPRIPSSETLTSFATSDSPQSATANPSKEKTLSPPPASDLPEQFRATLSRLSTLERDLTPLPHDCSFTVAIELRDEDGVEAPLGNPQPWIAAEPGLQKEGKRGEEDGRGSAEGRKTGRDIGGVRTTPVRSLEAGAFVMEVWVEEGKGKFDARDGINAGQ
ncbi:MAG: hypothetical protein Q9191_004548 [Dirinaria sp. TL-2023a]